MKTKNSKDEELKQTLEKINERLGSIDRSLIKNTGDLEKHILRTQQNEEMISLLRQDVAPIKKHVNMVEGGLKLLGIISVIVGILKSFKVF